MLKNRIVTAIVAVLFVITALTNVSLLDGINSLENALACSGKLIKLVVGSNKATIDGKTVAVDPPPMVVKGKTMVPLRFIADAFGFETTFDAKTKGISIVSKDKPSLIALPAKSQVESIKSPDAYEKLEKTLSSNNFPSYLMNINAATTCDLTKLGISKTVYVPITPSKEYGGRNPIFNLQKNTEVVTGAYFNDDGIALNIVKRLSGDSIPAKTGDTYSLKILSQDRKKVIFDGTGKITKTLPDQASFQFNGTSPTAQSMYDTRVRVIVTVNVFCFFWSLFDWISIKVEIIWD